MVELQERLDSQTITILNVLSLLSKKPMSCDEMWEAGVFRFRDGLEISILTLLRSGCIEKYDHVFIIRGFGFSLLGLYPSWKLFVDFSDVVVPIYGR